jgi:hypothetical protein
MGFLNFHFSHNGIRAEAVSIAKPWKWDAANVEYRGNCAVRSDYGASATDKGEIDGGRHLIKDLIITGAAGVPRGRRRVSILPLARLPRRA